MKLFLDGTTGLFEPGDYVVYIPTHLLIGPKSEMIQRENLGMVTSKNENFVFVRYHSGDTAAATKPRELFRLDNRPDLIEETKLKLAGK